MLGCWDHIHRWWGKLDSGPATALPRARHSLPLLLLLSMALYRTRPPTIPPLLCPFGLAKRYDKTKKNKLNNCEWTRFQTWKDHLEKSLPRSSQCPCNDAHRRRHVTIYNYIRNMSTYVHICFFVNLLFGTKKINIKK